jgi:hypothetical protein
MNKNFKIFDSVFFEYDLEMIKFRFEEVGPLVDYIIILESKLDLEGNKKKLLFKENLNLFKKWEDKIILVEWFSKDTDTNKKDRITSCYDYIKTTLLENYKSFEDIIFLSNSNELPDYRNIEEIINKLSYNPIYLSHDNFVWNIDYVSKQKSYGSFCFKFTNLIQDKKFFNEIYDNSEINIISPIESIKNGWKFTKFTSTNKKNELFLKDNLLPYEKISPITTYMLTLRDDTIELPVKYDLLPYNKIGRNYVKKHLFIVDHNTDQLIEFWEKEYDTISIIDFSNNLNEIFVNPITHKTTVSTLFVPNKVLYGDKSLKEFQEDYKKNEIKKIIHTVFPQDQDNIRIIYNNANYVDLWLNLKNEILSEIINPSS